MVGGEVAHVADADDRAMPGIERAAHQEAPFAQRLHDRPWGPGLGEPEGGDRG